jgi:predicted ribosomally synthesized peptide with SipW-like signal peptide
MNTRIILSLAIIGAVAAIAIGGTVAYFSDTETSTGNTFTAGTIDISVDNMNPWIHSYTLADMKPGYTDYINFEIQNTGSDPNPVDVWKNIHVISEATGAQSEPECTEEQGTWDNSQKTCTSMGVENNNLSAAIIYDLNVEVYDATGTKVWWQTIYVDSDNKNLDDVYGVNGDQKVYLGMIPAGGNMKVAQSYHLAASTTNWAQGDIMTFDITLTAEQMKGTAVLENKTAAPDYKLVLGDDIQGTLSYIVKNPTFKYTFTGKAPIVSTSYTLLYAVDPWPQTGSKVLGTGVSDGTGNISISGDIETGDMKDAKVWLVLSSDWNGTNMTAWHQTQYLLETGLIWFDDTDN